MKLILAKNFRENERLLMRHCGYFEIYNRQTSQISYLRPMRRTPYPRFHIYINQFDQNGLALNLHLDSKKPSYSGSHAHSGEYDSEVVADEAERIKTILNRL